MTTTTSSSNRTPLTALYRNILRRFGGITALYALLSFLFFPLQYTLSLASLREPEDLERLYLMGYSGTFTGISAFFYTAIMIVAPVLFSVMLFSYLHNRPAVDFYHAVPIQRHRLLLVHLAAGSTMLLVPMILCFLTVMLVGCFYQNQIEYSALAILQDLLVWMALALINFVLATFVGLYMGTGFDHVVYTLGLNFVPPALVVFTDGMMGWSILGMVSDLGSWVLNLSPMTLIGSWVLAPSAFGVSSGRAAESFSTQLWGVAIWLVISLVLVWLGCLVYQRRKSEWAGSTGRRNPINLTVQLAATYVFGGLLGLFFEEIITDGQNGSLPLFLAGTLTGAFTTFVIIETVNARGFSTFKRSLPLLGGSCAFMALFSVFLHTGGFGYESFVPSPASVTSVNISYEGRYEDLYDLSLPIELRGEEALGMVHDLHRSVLDVNLDRRAQRRAGNYETKYYFSTVQLEYKLMGFLPVKRKYDVVDDDFSERMMELISTEEYRSQAHPVFSLEVRDVQQVILSNRIFTRNEFLDCSEEQLEALLQALRTDLNGETREQLEQSDLQAACVLELLPTAKSKQPHSFVMVLPEYQNTLQVLESMGYPAASLLPNVSDITSVEIYAPYEFGYHSSSLVSTFMGPYHFSEEIGMGTYLTRDRLLYADTLDIVTDPTMIAELIGASYNDLARGLEDWDEEDNYQLLFRCSGQKRLIPLRLKCSDLPASRRAELEERIVKNREDEAYQLQLQKEREFVYPDTVAG